mmetsp:Transcript_43219/g.69305  ORF Transcript_43219/g.69305 Transcript_43219/m.69305 type:complete len:211 (-) Transcript_43219:6598-7230(-)
MSASKRRLNAADDAEASLQLGQPAKKPKGTRQFVAFFRGINVSGKKCIRMVDLRSHMATIGLQEVKTYVQTGNVVFNCVEDDISKIESMIKAKVRSEYGFDVCVIVKTRESLELVVKGNPYQTQADKDPTKVLVSFLSQVPLSSAVDTLQTVGHAGEKFEVHKDVVYLYVPNGYGKATLNNNVFERKLNVGATSRNWRTVVKVVALVDEE